jgi:hypothetical protein
MVPAHGVDCDGQHGFGIALSGAGTILFLLDFYDFPALILPAMRARTVRQLLFVAVGTFRQSGLLQPVVCAAVAPPGG